MYYQFTVLSIIFLVNSCVLIALALHAWKRRQVKEELFFSLLMFGCAFWAFAGAMEIAVLPAEGKILWSKVSYTGIV